MDTLNAGRRWAALIALSLGGFGLGLTEFVAMGLLPDMARDLLPEAYAASVPDALAQTGWMITIYALGVVAGAPTIAVLTTRVPRRRLVVGLLVLFVVATAASALAPTFELVLAARFVAALGHGAYFGAAGLLAAAILGPGNHGKGVSIVIGGLTAANLVGVPLITVLGQSRGWEAAYLAVAGVFAFSLVAVLTTVPSIAAPTGGSPRAELQAFRSPQVWLVALAVAVGTSGFFAVNTYVAPITTHVAGLDESTIPWILAAMGLGMTVGIALGGIAADRDLRRSVLFGFAGLIGSVAFFAVAAGHPAGLVVGAFLVGAASLFIVPALQSRLIAVAPGAQLMGAAVNQSSLNVANSIGAALGGTVIAAGWGYLASAWLGIALSFAGLLLALVSFRLDRVTAPASADSSDSSDPSDPSDSSDSSAEEPALV